MLQISVVMAVCENDSIEDLDRCLKSIFSSLEATDELILVHDGPASEGIINFVSKLRHKNFVFLETRFKNGLTDCINTGVQRAKNEWIGRIDPDDYCLPDRFLKQKEQLIFHKYPDVLCSSIVEFSENRRVTRKCKICDNVVHFPFWFRNPIYNVTTLFRRQMFIDLGGYEKLPNFIDYFFWCKVFYGGYRIHCEEVPSVMVNVGNDLSRRRGGWRYAKSEVNFYHKLYQLSYINLPIFVTILFLRLPVRFLPNFVRKILWKRRL